MEKKSLLTTNPYLKDPRRRKEGLIRSVASSSAIEGIRVSEKEMEAWQSPTPAQRKRARSGKRSR